MDILCLDFDEVVIQTEHIVSEVMGKVIPKASKEYQALMKKSFQCGLITEFEYKSYLREYYDYRNQFLEEVCDKYIGLIDYKSIYVSDNFFPGTLKNVQKICDSNEYAGIYITTHYNVEREKKCKEELIYDCFPKVKYIPIKFYAQKYESGVSRIRTSKATYIKEMLGLSNMDNVVLIDDSSTNVEEMNNMRGTGIQYMDQSIITDDKKSNEELLTSLDPLEIAEKVKRKRLALYK